MSARSVTAFLRDVASSKAAQRNYRMRAAVLRERARLEVEAGQPLTARVTRYRAFIAENAARAEYFDPEPGR